MSARNLALALAATLALGACSSPKPAATAPPTPTTASPSPSPSPTTTEPTATTVGTQPPTTLAAEVATANIIVPNMVGEDLQLAQDTMQASDLYLLRSHDATGQERNQVLDRSWKVCDQNPVGGSTVTATDLITFEVVKDAEGCP